MPKRKRAQHPVRTTLDTAGSIQGIARSSKGEESLCYVCGEEVEIVCLVCDLCDEVADLYCFGFDNKPPSWLCPTCRKQPSIRPQRTLLSPLADMQSLSAQSSTASIAYSDPTPPKQPQTIAIAPCAAQPTASVPIGAMSMRMSTELPSTPLPIDTSTPATETSECCASPIDTSFTDHSNFQDKHSSERASDLEDLEAIRKTQSQIDDTQKQLRDVDKSLKDERDGRATLRESEISLRLKLERLEQCIKASGKIISNLEESRSLKEAQLRESETQLRGLIDSRSPQDDMIIKFAALGNYDPAFHIALAKADLCLLNDLTEKTKRTWEECGTQLPIVVSANESFVTEPTWDILYTMAHSSKTSTVFGLDGATKDEQRAMAFNQMDKPNREAPVYMLCISSDYLDKEYQFRLPQSLRERTQASDEDDTLLNMVPQHAFVPFHIDYGVAGASRTLEECVKYWLMFPPTLENLRHMADANAQSTKGQAANRSDILRNLMGGIVVETTSDKVLYIPAGCIHSTHTVSGGFLIAKDFVTKDTYGTMMRLIESGFLATCDSGTIERFFKWLFIARRRAEIDGKKFHQSLVANQALLKTVIYNCNIDRDFEAKLKSDLVSVFAEICDAPYTCPCAKLTVYGAESKRGRRRLNTAEEMLKHHWAEHILSPGTSKLLITE